MLKEQRPLTTASGDFLREDSTGRIRKANSACNRETSERPFHEPSAINAMLRRQILHYDGLDGRLNRPRMERICPLLLLFTTLAHSAAVSAPSPWVPDLGDGTYKNPVLFADYSDPDAIRVGDDYYLTSSSFTCVPGLPILHSKDLVNWRIINQALPRQIPEATFGTPQHGKGVWAPCLRFHKGSYYIYYGDPDYGIYVVTAQDPTAEWTQPVRVKSGRGLIDPTPFWDDDGQAYLLHAWAMSRAGTNNILTLHKLSDDGTKVTDGGRVIIDGNKLSGYRTLEGPKFYKRDGWYYVFAPAGGVAQGWQSVFRSRKIDGPYENRVVLDQGHTPVNGPHQGALVDTVTGESWFLHFQERQPYGRVVHLQPVMWEDGWPIMGSDPDGDGRGEPVLSHAKPDVGGAYPITVPQTSDEFEGSTTPGVQWQWQANPQSGWYSFTSKAGALRLFPQPTVSSNSLYGQPNVLLQKFPAPEFTATTRLTFEAAATGEKAGLVVFGFSYAWIGLERTSKGIRLRQVVCRDARSNGNEHESAAVNIDLREAFLRVDVYPGGGCRFHFSEDGKDFSPLGLEFQATEGQWIGAKVGLFTVSNPANDEATGHADFEWFRITRLERD